MCKFVHPNLILDGMGSTGKEIYRKTDFYKVKSRQMFIFTFLAKLFETCFMVTNNDLDGEITHFYCFLPADNKGT